MVEKSNTVEPIIPQTPLAFVRFSLAPVRGKCIAMVAIVLCASILDTITPYLFKLMIDAALSANKSEFIFWTIAYPVVFAVMYAGWRVSGIIGAIALPRATAYAYNRLIEHLIRHSDAYFSNSFAGSVAAKVSRAVTSTNRLTEDGLWHYFPSAVQFVSVLIFTTLTNVVMGAMFFVAVCVLVVLNLYFVKKYRPYVEAYAEAESALSGTTVDVVTNIRVVHHFARFSHEEARINERIDAVRAADQKQFARSEWILIANSLIVCLLIASMSAVLAYLWIYERVTTGDVVLVLTLLYGITGTLIFIGQAMNGIVRHWGEIKEGLEKILVAHDIVDAPNAVPLSVTQGAITFKDVSFSYLDSAAPVFGSLSISIAPQQRVGLVGASGAGKSSFVNLLLRQHEVASGHIAIDGQHLSEVTLESLRGAIAVVPQESMLFHRSIRENIAYGNPNATDEDVIRAAQLAYAHEFITQTPHGYDTVVGERGVKLSGGQRQRIAIARAILKNAPILVLDEATSALDSESEVAIQRALKELMAGKTVIAVAHRLSTLREMDRIIVLEKGCVVQDGTPDALLSQEGVFKTLWEHQSGGFLQEDES